jgi:hypothetical protein
MDERLLSIVKAMALGPICSDDWSSVCLHCDSDEDDRTLEFLSIRHKPGCPVLLARAIMKEQGTPVNIYKVTFQLLGKATSKRQYWRTANNYTIAFTLEDAIKEYTHESHHNVQAEFVREAPC